MCSSRITLIAAIFSSSSALPVVDACVVTWRALHYNTPNVFEISKTKKPKIQLSAWHTYETLTRRRSFCDKRRSAQPRIDDVDCYKKIETFIVFLKIDSFQLRCCCRYKREKRTFVHELNNVRIRRSVERRLPQLAEEGFQRVCARAHLPQLFVIHLFASIVHGFNLPELYRICLLIFLEKKKFVSFFFGEFTWRCIIGVL